MPAAQPLAQGSLASRAARRPVDVMTHSRLVLDPALDQDPAPRTFPLASEAKTPRVQRAAETVKRMRALTRKA